MSDGETQGQDPSHATTTTPDDAQVGDATASAEATRASYDRVAAEYAAHIADELTHKPLERDLLAAFAHEARGTVCDVGCGPGHVAAYLAAQGADVFGLDLSPAMVEEARRLTPGLRFEAGDLRALPVADGALGGIVALYCLLHLPRGEVVGALREFARAHAPDGLLLVGMHVGEEVRHLDEWWGQRVTLDFVFFTMAEMAGYLRDAGFEIERTIEREPYPEVEVQTRRAYFVARNAARPHA